MQPGRAPGPAAVPHAFRKDGGEEAAVLGRCPGDG
jgi:hypothetical protein